MEKETKKLLEVGDVIYSVSRYTINGAYVIDRITNTQAISKTTKFRREISDNGWIRLVGSAEAWSMASYWLETDELKNRYSRQKFVSEIRAFEFNSLSDEDLKKIVSIINP